MGFLTGLLGIGGGMTLVSILAALFSAQGLSTDHNVHMALAAAMASASFTSSASVREHHKHGGADCSSVKLTVPGMVTGLPTIDFRQWLAVAALPRYRFRGHYLRGCDTDAAWQKAARVARHAGADAVVRDWDLHRRAIGPGFCWRDISDHAGDAQLRGCHARSHWYGRCHWHSGHLDRHTQLCRELLASS